jgi:hypothetical protein
MFCKYAKDAPDLRPCLADGKPATFHRWVEEDRALMRVDTLMKREDLLKAIHLFNEKGAAGAGSTILAARTPFALVEYPDGSVGRVKPELIQFLDRKEG